MTSIRNNLNTGLDPYDIVIDKIAELFPLGELMLLGDLNSRMSGLTDFSQDEENENNVDFYGKQITITDLIQNNISIERASEDKGINEYGRNLAALCEAASLLPLNGRFGSDKNIGKITYLETRKNKVYKSIVDYIICSKFLLYNLIDFKVMNTNVYSDHAILQVDLKCKVIRNAEANILTEYAPYKKPKWKEEYRDEYLSSLSTEEVKNQLSSIANSIDEAVTLDDEIIDKYVLDLCNVINRAGKSHFVLFGNKNADENKNVQSINNFWYDSECRDKKRIFEIYEKKFRESNLDEDRVNMCNARNKYRKVCRYKRMAYQSEKANDLLNLSKNNPRKFWKVMKKKKMPSGDCDFDSYFKEVFNIQPDIRVSEEIFNNICIDQIYNLDILNGSKTLTELENGINNLKNNKACGIDGILNEFLKNSNISVRHVILKLFNAILESGIFPSQWTIGEIVPVFKKGNINEPSNYRPITLISSVGKLFTYCLNEKMNIFAEKNKIISENQFGFRKDKSTTDCLFILHGLIEQFLNKSEKFYCCFVDLSRAFDGLDRDVLWYKLINSGISCKIVNLLKNMYSKIKLCVKKTFQKNENDLDKNILNQNENSTSQSDNDYFFSSKAGVFQGESLSPFLFSMYINDLNSHLEADDIGIEIEDLIFTSLLFADDMVIFSKTREGLQAGLDSLKRYCETWGLTVNRSKTKCVAFKKGGKIGKKDIWYYGGEVLETVNSFKYLGFMFGSSGKFSKGIQTVLEQSNKALFSMKSLQYQYPEIMPKNQLYLFNALVKPVLNNSSEIWGFCEADKLERVHLSFLKYVLNVRKSTPSAFVYKELNVFPLIVTRYFKIFKFWLKIITSPDTSFIKHIYKLLCRDIDNLQDNPTTNWAALVRKMLFEHGLGFIWYNQRHLRRDDTMIINIFQQRIKDHFWQKINGDITVLSKNRLYTHLNVSSVSNHYLFNIKEKYIRNALTKIRLGSHNFMVERGRWNNLELIDRQCSNCYKVEDEYHIIMECPLYKEWRNIYLPSSLLKKPSMFNLINFIDTIKNKDLRSFGIYCHKVFKYYNENIL